MMFLRIKIRFSGLVLCLCLLIASVLVLFLSGAGKVLSIYDDSTERISFLQVHGWLVEGETAEQITIPQVFGTVYEEYNELQKKQGYDLSLFAGKTVTKYTYTVLNYPSSETVLAHLLVCDGMIIAADICSTAIDGFISVL